ncbi:hypothetical protein Bbelb_303370 [Branchiostoma belcheri]|nr:hypothetical protein Bbelb_303370 [Branchiostoma belcheri]
MAELGTSEAQKQPSRQGQQKLVILDVDPGIDDAIAMMMVLSQPAVRVLAVTCVRGNAREVLLDCKNALRVLQAAGRADIPVYVGASLQLMGNDVYDYTYWNGRDSMGDAPDKYPPDYRLINQAEHAVLTLIRMSKAFPNQITLIALGPLTNVALARRMDPDISSRFKEIIIMGGNIRGEGNIGISAEFNFWMDPEAAQVVLREYKCPMKVVPWEVCQEHGLEWARGLRPRLEPKAAHPPDPRRVLLGVGMGARFRHPHETPSSSPPPFCFAPAPFCFAPAKNLLRPRHDFRVDCELCRHWGLSRRTGAKQNCAGGVEERRGRSRFFAGAKQNGAGAKQNGGGEEEGDFFANWTAMPTRRARFIKAISLNLSKWLRAQGEPTYLSCDPLATAIVIDTGIVEGVDTVYATVEVEGEYTRAQMVVDWWGFRRKTPNVDIIRSLNMSRYKSLLMTAM